MLMTVQIPHVYMVYAKTSTLNTTANVQMDSGVQIAQVCYKMLKSRQILLSIFFTSGYKTGFYEFIQK